MTNFIQRLITGILFVTVMGGALIVSPVSYSILMTCIITLSTIEFCKIAKALGYLPHVHVVLIINVVAFMLGFFIYYASFDPRILLTLIAFLWCIFLLELFSNSQKPIMNIALSLMCVIYIGLPFALFNLLAFKNGYYDYRPIISLFILSWTNDTGAYLCGVTLGRHKLYERISPKKTIEGFIGGVTFTLAASYILYCVSELDLIFCLGCGLIVSVIGTCGDLIESMLKRAANLKDSGSVLPGHGGVLDRFDALIFSAPLVSLLYFFFL